MGTHYLLFAYNHVFLLFVKPHNHISLLLASITLEGFPGMFFLNVFFFKLRVNDTHSFPNYLGISSGNIIYWTFQLVISHIGHFKW